MSNTIDPELVARFAAIYAEAVLTYLDAREAQWVTWDGDYGFDFCSVELDPPEDPVLLHVDESWHQLLGDLDASSDPDADAYDPEALRAAIEHELIEEGLGERVLKLYSEQQGKTAGDEDTDEDWVAAGFRRRGDRPRRASGAAPASPARGAFQIPERRMIARAPGTGSDPGPEKAIQWQA